MRNYLKLKNFEITFDWAKIVAGNARKKRTEKSCIVSNYRQFSTKIKQKS